MTHMTGVLPLIVSIFISALASSGLWAFVIHKSENKNSQAQMLLGLGHDRIVYLGLKYINRGYITQDEYENLYNYLYVPYTKLNGNGSAKRIMNEVDKLEIRCIPYPKNL